MPKFNIIPAIDLIDGQCVRLTQGDYSRSKVYSPDPVSVAKEFEEAGATRLHLVDLDGAKASGPRNLDVLERIASSTSMEVEFGGGIKSGASLKSVLDAGAAYAICGSVAITDPDLFRTWLNEYSDRIILGLDIRNGKVATHGWLETSEATVSDVLKAFGGLVRKSIVTEIAHDGMLMGVDVDFYSELQAAFPEVEIVVSGGVSGEECIKLLCDNGLHSAIVGKAIYEGRIDLAKMIGQYAG
ncbi:MAG: 1-(5-phosphoribosyl)-5-[(5-phosphoribosylamino)methylideneamino]imidazole-4-carboxamide isomerase [Candidatus Cryptobacteroides sp.]